MRFDQDWWNFRDVLDRPWTDRGVVVVRGMDRRYEGGVTEDF